MRLVQLVSFCVTCLCRSHASPYSRELSARVLSAFSEWHDSKVRKHPSSLFKSSSGAVRLRLSKSLPLVALQPRCMDHDTRCSSASSSLCSTFLQTLIPLSIRYAQNPSSRLASIEGADRDESRDTKRWCIHAIRYWNGHAPIEEDGRGRTYA